LSRSPDPDPDTLLADPRVGWVEDVLRFCDTDQNGHVNNTTFAALAESGRVALFRTGLGVRSGATYFVVARLAIDFRAELRYPGRVSTGTWITTLGRSSLTLRQAILSEDRELAALTEAVCVRMETATRRPTPFAGETRERAEALLRPDGAGPAR
jgi:acyl-CoA thioester hydrolase